MAALATAIEAPPAAPRISLHACKHGMYSKTVVLPGEDQSRFEALGETYQELYQPQTPLEIELVERLQITQWRLSRAVALDMNLHTLGASEHIDEIDQRFGELDDPTRHALAQAAAFLANSRVFDQLSRQESRLQRLYDRTRKELDELLAERPSISLAGPDPQPLPAAAPAQSGFVSQIAPDPTAQFTGPLANIKRHQWRRQQETLKAEHPR